MNFHISQQVVYVGTDRYFDPNPGKTVHTIHQMRKPLCGCNYIDVGKKIHTDFDSVRCVKCGHIEATLIYWKSSEDFRPLISDYSESEIAEVNIEELVEPLY